MKKFLHSLLILFMGITTAAFAQQEEAATVTAWDGSDKSVDMEPGDLLTFAYTATSQGTLYIYADQSEADNVPLSIWGGWYHDGAYDADFPLSEASDYNNGLGVYGWIKVYSGDVIRFTIAAAEEAEGNLTEFTLKSHFFTDNAGSSWENPVALTKDTKVTLQPFKNTMEALESLWIDYATWCSFTAPSDGVASIYTEENVVYYIKAEDFGFTEELPQSVPQDEVTNDHEFMVEGGKEYLVFVPNSRPTDVTFKMTYDRLGLSEKFPIEIKEFPADLNLVKGNNYYKFSHELIGGNTMMEVVATAGWNGTITYMEATNWGAQESEELVADAVAGEAVTFLKSVDTRFLLMGDALVVNFNVTDQETAKASLTLRAPGEGESFETAVVATLGENAFNSPARGDYWFAYTAEVDAEVSLATSASLKHVNFEAGVELLVPGINYRVHEGETIYVCVAAAAGNHTLTITSKEIVAGDYCDKPIEFKLGEDVVIEGRGVDNFHSFTAEQAGFAVFTSPGWSITFREECGGRSLSPQTTVNEEDENNIVYNYRLPVAEGQSYIVEVQTVSEDVTIATAFEAAAAGDVCATAIALESMDTLKLDYEFRMEKWYKITADKSGFYIVYAKLGQAASMKTKVGDCDAKEINAGNDSSKPNAYMGGYEVAKVYVEEGQTLYIYTRTGSSNGGEEFSEEFYLAPTFAEPRPGEDVAVAIAAESGKEYEVMTNTDGYEQWYAYTIPAGKEMVVTLSATKKFIMNSLSFYKEDKTTSMSLWNGDYTQTNLTNDAAEIVGKNYSFAAADAPRTIYIKAATVNALYAPVVWSIKCDDKSGDDTDIETPAVTGEAPVIYDLMGRRVENPGKGIYIINGVKRVIK